MTGSDWGWWRDRRPPAARLHLDTAAAGRSSRAILAAAAAHAEREAETGGYVAAAEAEPVLAAGRAALGDLLGVPAAGVAFTRSGEGALGALLDIWPLPEGATVAVAPAEWGPNLDAFGARGLRITQLPAEGDGTVDLAALERMLAAGPPAVVHLVQVTSHRGLVQPVAAAAGLCRAAGVPLWVDAAQALGHVDAACGADAIYATSRKWLTGPRGVGLLGVTGPWWDGLTVSTPQLYRAAQPADSQPAAAAVHHRGQRGGLDRPVHGRRRVPGNRPACDLGPAGRGRPPGPRGPGGPARLGRRRPGGRAVRHRRPARGRRPGRHRGPGPAAGRARHRHHGVHRPARPPGHDRTPAADQSRMSTSPPTT